jgi:hypothetical protein
MNKTKNYFKIWLITLLLFVIMTGCEDRVGIVSPPVVTTPTVSLTSPANVSTGIGFGSSITATFSEEMNSQTITTATFTLMQGTLFVSGTVSLSGVTATFKPSSNLAPNTLYTATITTGAVDKEGTALAENYVWSFTTGAAAAVISPIVNSTDPLNSATGVPFNQKIAATFSVAMNSTTITASTFILKQGTTSVSGFVSYTGTTATFAPTSNLAPNTAYTATITTGAANLEGNGLAANYVWSFTTGAAAVVTPPTVSSTDPALSATGVALNQKIAATFSKTMDASTFTTPSFTLTQGTTSISGYVSYSGTTAIFAPAGNLVSNTVYTATITTAVKDLAGNALAANYVWSFTTGAAAVVTPPQVSLTDPINVATGVALNQKIAATFTKTMDASTITTSTFTLMQGTTSVSGFVSYTGITAIFSPANYLNPNTIYTATITTGSKDLAGNALAANYVWSFTTGAAAIIVPPTVISTDPADAATGVSLSKQITAAFSKTMDASTITTSTFTLNRGTTSVSGFVSYSGTTATFAPASSLLANTVYTATITTGSKDLAGNALEANYVWSFTTGAAAVVIPPVVTSTDPLNGAIGVVFNKHITATFSKTMDASTITTSNFTLMQGSSFVSGTVSYVGMAATFIPSSNLVENTVYTATVTTEAKDLAGISMASNYVWSFTTAISVYTVTLSANPAEGGTVNGSGQFNSGSSVTVTAAEKVGYTFDNWTENGIAVSINTNYTFIITGNRTLVANFTALPSGPSAVDLGSAGDFAILAGSAVSNTGVTTHIYGDVGSFPTSTINGLLAGNVTGTLYMTADPIVDAAKTALTTAYNDAQGRSLNAISLPGQLGGLTLAPGLYVNSTSSGISGTGSNAILTLDAGGNPNAVWIFKVGSTFITDAGTSIVLAGGAQWKNIYWSVGTSATLGTNSVFYGNILADQAITLTTGAILYGRALTRIAAVTLDTNIVDKR